MRKDLVSILLAVVQRVFLAGSNFVLIISGGRILEIAEFGSLTLILTLVALCLIPHSSFITEPMLVYGPREYKYRQQKYHVILLGLQFGLITLITFLMLIGTVILKIYGLYITSNSLWLIIVLTYVVLTNEFHDRFLFTQFRAVIPAVAAGLQFFTVIFGVIGLTQLTEVNIEHLLSIFILGAIFSGILMISTILGSKTRPEIKKIYFQSLIKRHIRFGGWSIWVHAGLFLATQFYILITPLIVKSGINIVADYRSISVLSSPAVQGFSALGVIAIPILRSSTSRILFRKRALILIQFTTFAGIGWTCLAGISGSEVSSLLYNGKFNHSAVDYWLAGSFPMFMGLTFALGSIIRSLDQASLLAKATCISAFVSFPPNLALILTFGATGVLAAQLLSTALIVITSCIYLKGVSWTGEQEIGRS